jgi:hypothetical protein
MLVKSSASSLIPPSENRIQLFFCRRLAHLAHQCLYTLGVKAFFRCLSTYLSNYFAYTAIKSLLLFSQFKLKLNFELNEFC